MATDLQAAAQNIYDLFNKVDYDNLTAVMDPGIVVKKVLHPGSISGIKKVKDYLKKQMAPHGPRFLNVIFNFNPPDAVSQAKAVDADVSGRGDYWDDKNDPSPTPVVFTWSFTRADTTKDWVLINVYGQPAS